MRLEEYVGPQVPDPSYIDFGVPWVMRIESKKGSPPKIQFNREDYPDLGEDEFAERVMEVLEISFGEWLVKRSKPSTENNEG